MSETYLPQVIMYKGVPAAELSKDKLLEALRVAMRIIDKQKREMAREREMELFFADARDVYKRRYKPI